MRCQRPGRGASAAGEVPAPGARCQRQGRGAGQAGGTGPPGPRQPGTAHPGRPPRPRPQHGRPAATTAARATAVTGQPRPPRPVAGRSWRAPLAEPVCHRPGARACRRPAALSSAPVSQQHGGSGRRGGSGPLCDHPKTTRGYGVSAVQEVSDGPLRVPGAPPWAGICPFRGICAALWRPGGWATVPVLTGTAAHPPAWGTRPRASIRWAGMTPGPVVRRGSTRRSGSR